MGGLGTVLRCPNTRSWDSAKCPTLEWVVLRQWEVSQPLSIRSYDSARCPNTRSWDSVKCPNTRTKNLGAERSVPTLEWVVLGQCEVSQHLSERVLRQCEVSQHLSIRPWDNARCPNTRSWDSVKCPNTRTKDLGAERSVPTLEWVVLGQCEVSQHLSERVFRQCEVSQHLSIRSWDSARCPNTRSWDSVKCPNTRTKDLGAERSVPTLEWEVLGQYEVSQHLSR